KYFKPTYRTIITEYKKIFPFVREARITELAEFNTNIAITADVPVFSIRERGSDKWIPIDQLSSGMQKVLLILTDIFLIPDGGVYIIDEYENSLGISAIDFFPDFILTLEKNVQFIITSHHPYIINAIPYKNWYLFHRDGMRVSIKYGEELVKRFGTSRQEAFVQLINDPFFTDGVVVE
ncbi:MAG: AAA family ATPase, partial [Aquificales bacterium]|nr:AAA family ATPase [Aquificales bacterium]